MWENVALQTAVAWVLRIIKNDTKIACRGSGVNIVIADEDRILRGDFICLKCIGKHLGLVSFSFR